MKKCLLSLILAGLLILPQAGILKAEELTDGLEETIGIILSDEAEEYEEETSFGAEEAVAEDLEDIEEDLDELSSVESTEDELSDPEQVRKTSKVTITGYYNSSKGGDIRWSRADGATGYALYRKRAADGLKKVATISNPNTLQYIDGGIKDNCWGRVYVYYVRPIIGGAEGAKSNEVTLQRLAPMKITKITSDTVGQAKLTWACTVNENKALGYEIQYAQTKQDLFDRTGSFKKVSVNGRNNLNRTITGMAQGKTYYFRVRCYVNYTHSVTGQTTKTWSQYSDVKSVKIASNGTGTQDDPYRISSFAQLKKLADHNGSWFIQVADINCGGAEMEPIFSTDNPFTGKYNGNGKSISNLKLTTRYQGNKSYDLTGIWGEISSSGKVTDLRLNNMTMISTYKRTASFGPVCALNYGTVSGISVSNLVIINKDPLKENGGICGENYGTISNCSCTNFVDQYSGSKYSGGITGYNDGTIRSCTVTNANLNAQVAGGITGYNYYHGRIDGCRIYGTINFNSSWVTGTFAGQNDGGTIVNCARY